MRKKTSSVLSIYKLRDQDLSRNLWPKQPLALKPDLTLLEDRQSNSGSLAYDIYCSVWSHQCHAEQSIAKT
jgi:hypothetical protein